MGQRHVIALTIIDTDRLIDADHVVTQLELMIGCRNKSKLRNLDKFIKQFQIIKLNEAISEKAVELLRPYRLSHGLLIADSLIAATAMALNLLFFKKPKWL